jgi:hypothetical protein
MTHTEKDKGELKKIRDSTYTKPPKKKVETKERFRKKDTSTKHDTLLKLS